MNKSFLSSENFKTRVSTGVLLAIIVIAALFTPNVLGFRILFAAAGFMACLELYLAHKSQIYRGILMKDDRVLILEYAVILIAIYSMSSFFERNEIILVILGAISTDIFAYFVGSTFHDKLFKTRPFPKISPKKSWEGIIGGVVGCIITLFVSAHVMHVEVTTRVIVFIIACPIISIFGDWFASFCKRFLKIKDSSDCIRTSALMFPKMLERLVAGHGGYLDRIDSISAVACLMFWVKLAN